mmetsp:Transcript_21555/g.61801  ORF Transcript_21555/g.61801 Transcript_21555/m.61801 type:complete len:92 (+) Transcript_21555:1934-2209(+)
MWDEDESGAQRRVDVTRRVDPWGRAARQAKCSRRTRPSAGASSSVAMMMLQGMLCAAVRISLCVRSFSASNHEEEGNGTISSAVAAAGPFG